MNEDVVLKGANSLLLCTWAGSGVGLSGLHR